MIARLKRRVFKSVHGMRPRVTLRQALDDTALLGNVLTGDSWHYWKPVLLATVGEALTTDELTIFREVTGGRTAAPNERVEEAAFVIGRRGGKDRAASVLATYFATLCQHPQLVPGERGIVFCLGGDQRQAKVTRNYIEAVLKASPVLSRLIVNLTQDSIQLINRIDIEVRAASFRRVRGPTCIAVIATESAFWLGEDSSNPDTEILNALRPTLATTGGPLIQISSPYARRGELWETYRQHYGPKGDPRILVVQGPSRLFNPTLPQSVVARALERDPAAASAEYLAQFRTDVENFVSLETIRACIEPGVFEHPPLSGVRYFGFADPSGGSADSFTIGIAHREKEIAVLDAVREVRPPFSPESVVAEFAKLLKTYRVTRIESDRYGGEWPAEQFRKHGVTVEPSDKSKSELYVDLLPALNSRCVSLLDLPRLNAQLCNLERRTSRGGKDSIDHPPGSHDDVANAAAGALVQAASKAAPMKIPDTVVAMSRLPRNHPSLPRTNRKVPMFFR